MSNPLIGIIAEDDSDVECVKAFVRRLHSGRQLGFKKFVGQGCGRISRKTNAWAQNFKIQGCNVLILVHDLDRNVLPQLQSKINAALLPSPIPKYFISIPVEELEAWLLSDEQAIRSVFNITQSVALPFHPETVKSPKEFLGKLVRRETNKKVDYLNTKHNEKLSLILDLQLVAQKCPTFQMFQSFVATI